MLMVWFSKPHGWLICMWCKNQGIDCHPHPLYHVFIAVVAIGLHLTVPWWGCHKKLMSPTFLPSPACHWNSMSHHGLTVNVIPPPPVFCSIVYCWHHMFMMSLTSVPSIAASHWVHICCHLVTIKLTSVTPAVAMSATHITCISLLIFQIWYVGQSTIRNFPVWFPGPRIYQRVRNHLLSSTTCLSSFRSWHCLDTFQRGNLHSTLIRIPLSIL